MGSYSQGVLQPGVLQRGVLTTRGLTFRGSDKQRSFNPLSMLEILAHGLITMSMNTHIGKVCSKVFRGLYNIRQIRKYLSAESRKCLIQAFVTSHLDLLQRSFV